MDIFFHIRILIGIILSLSITHLLKGGVKFIEHPGKKTLLAAPGLGLVYIPAACAFLVVGNRVT